MSDIYHSSNISVVVDNNILVDLFELGCIDLLFSVFEFVTIPKVIYDDEIPQEIKDILNNYDFQLGNLNTLVGLETYATLVNEADYKRLSRYDRFAIAIAKENAYYCNSNDKPVRKACMKLGVKCTGILGVLGRAYVKNTITRNQLIAFLDDLVSDNTSCFIDTRLVEEFKQAIEMIKSGGGNKYEIYWFRKFKK